jgi:hypothetical protein
MMWLPLFVTTLVLPLGKSLELPSMHVQAALAKKQSPDWWAQVGERIFYSPASSFLGLSQNVSDYYYVMGSKAALTDDIKKHCVGSEGRYHILHLPKGPSMLEVSHTSLGTSGDRRASISKLNKLQYGIVLSEGFPLYDLSADYQNPLDSTGLAFEKAGLDQISADSTMDYLRRLTAFPTRSYSNDSASIEVEHWLQKEFQAMGLTSCFHNFDNGDRQLTNVVAFVPGSSQSSVTVGAHYDSRPFDGKAPGAEDNGSGVAGLLEMARAFMRTKVTPKHSVYFVAFAGEEPGLIGSKHFAQALKAGGDALPTECRRKPDSFIQLTSNRKSHGSTEHRTNRAIIMDEIGWASSKLDKLTVNLETYDKQGKVVMDHLRHSSQDHNGDSLEVVHNAHPFGSDHMSFLDQGMEAALTINGDDEAYPFYHRSDDDITNVSPELLTKVVKMNYGALMRMCLA